MTNEERLDTLRNLLQTPEGPAVIDLFYELIEEKRLRYMTAKTEHEAAIHRGGEIAIHEIIMKIHKPKPNVTQALRDRSAQRRREIQGERLEFSQDGI